MSSVEVGQSFFKVLPGSISMLPLDLNLNYFPAGLKQTLMCPYTGFGTAHV